jgi:beta-phosphoglucomutase
MRFSETDNHLLRGVSRLESLGIIYRLNSRETPPPAEFEALANRKNGYYVDLVKQMTPADILPGALELLKELRAAAIRRAIASSSKNARIVLSRAGLGQYMDAVADGNDITHSKPHPEVFLTAARKLGVSPLECVGIEDAAAGVESIKAAGMRSIGVGEYAGEANVVVGSVGEIDVEMLRRGRGKAPGR